ncbi:hypothetical protein SAMN02990966_06125 [Rhodospirillales bacterium URHD0017]|nr:hypothetical protein SAMN02990966_06125 [Rhodospirillales bacterium URHD0017]
MGKSTIPTSPALYTDEQVIAATGMPVDSLRRLITWGAVRPAQAGGGRGRVRLWTTRQALRISSTAQFVATGLSLQMAHTLTYCIPLDSLLTLYDPERLQKALGQAESNALTAFDENLLLNAMTTEPQPTIWPLPGIYLGSSTLIVDGRFLYADVHGDGAELIAEIDSDRQRVAPYSDDPESTTFYDHFFNKGMKSDVTRIDKRTLLIDRKYFTQKGRASLLRKKTFAPTQVDGPVLCKSLLAINLALGFLLCVRALRGLPIAYGPKKISGREPQHK